MNEKRFYFQFYWWHSLLILLILAFGFLLWASTWDFEPEVEPSLTVNPEKFLTDPANILAFSLKITNKARIGYQLEPFEVSLIGGEATLLKFNCQQGYYVEARSENQEIPLTLELGSFRNLLGLSLNKLRVETQVTARKWGFSKTVKYTKELPLPSGLRQLNEAREKAENAVSELPKTN